MYFQCKNNAIFKVTVHFMFRSHVLLMCYVLPVLKLKMKFIKIKISCLWQSKFTS